MNTLTIPFSRSRQLLFLAVVTISTLILLFGACSGEQLTATAPESPESPDETTQPEIILAAPETEELISRGARRLILVIGDGMGAEQIRAASLYRTGTEDGLFLQGLPVYAEVATHSASHRITDSAASATAMASGVKVQNGAVGVRLPGDGQPLTLITGELAERGWRIGLVTTAFTTDSTPAAFGAHVAHRRDFAGIARDYLNVSRPHVIFGGGGLGMDPATVAAAGYTVVMNRDDLTTAVRAAPAAERIAGLFGRGHMPYLYDGRPAEMPGLVEMSERAVEFLAAGDSEFFLMIEGTRIDHAGHDNDIRRLIPEMLELDDVVEMLVKHPLLQEDTLIVVTGDHETGGLQVTDAFGAGVIPAVTWSTTGHTAVDVPLYATGVGAEHFVDVVDNTLLRGAMLAALEEHDPDPQSVTDATFPSADATLLPEEGIAQ